MNPLESFSSLQDRRRFLKGTTMGLGAAVLGSVLARTRAPGADGAGETSTGENGGLHFPAKAKRVIFLFMAGAPSQLDLFDYKPDLEKQFNQPLPKSVSRGQRVTAMTKGHRQIVAPRIFTDHLPGINLVTG